MAKLPPRETVLCVRNLVNRFGFKLVLDGVNLDVYRGEILGVVGGSGAGKSVLLRTIIGLNRQESGEIRIWGHDQADIDPDELMLQRRKWGVLFQDGALFSSLTVAQNIQVPLREHFKLSKSLMDDIAALKISLVGLPPEAGANMPADLSGGMRKRAGLARALALDPEILFLDEPTAGLDPIGAASFDNLIRELRDALGLTVFMVTHDLDTLHAVCDRVAVLAESRVIVVGTIDELIKFDHPWVQSYFRGPRARAAGLEHVGDK